MISRTKPAARAESRVLGPVVDEDAYRGWEMPVQKFRSLEEMKAAPVPDRRVPLERRIAALFARSAMLAPPIEKPKGVFKFRSIEEMQGLALGLSFSRPS